jgi:hypothetical protein
VVRARAGLRIGVHQRGGQPGQRVGQVVGDRDLMRLDGTSPGVDFAFGPQLMPGPPQADLSNVAVRPLDRLSSINDE